MVVPDNDGVNGIVNLPILTRSLLWWACTHSHAGTKGPILSAEVSKARIGASRYSAAVMYSR